MAVGGRYGRDHFDFVVARFGSWCLKADCCEVNHSRRIARGLPPQGRFVAAGGEVEDLPAFRFGQPLQALRHHPEAIFVAGGQGLVQKQRQRRCAPFLGSHPSQAQGEQQLHPGAGGKLAKGSWGVLHKVPGAESAVAVELKIKGLAGDFTEQLPSPMQHFGFVLGLESLLHIVEQEVGCFAEESLVAFVLKGCLGLRFLV